MPTRFEASPLRCLFVITSMPVGGAETLLVNMIRRLDPAILKPEVVCLKEPGPLGEQISSEFPVHANLLAGKWDLRILPRLVRLFHRRRADVVITVGAGDKMFWGRLAAHIAGVPAIASALHSTGWPDGVGKMNRMLTPFTDAFIAVANSHGQFLKEFEKFPEQKVHVIRNGVDCDRFKPSAEARHALRAELGLSQDSQLIGLVAALRSEKNHGMLINVAHQLRESHPRAHWIIVGDGPERASIESQVADLGLHDRVHLLGTRHDTPQIVSALDVFSLVSLNEASPVSILEALACGVPVASTDVGSIKESVKQGKTGFLVPSQDVAAMATAVGNLLDDPQLRHEMGAAGRALVLRSGSLDSMVRGYEDLACQLYDSRVHQQQTSPALQTTVRGEKHKQFPAT